MSYLPGISVFLMVIAPVLVPLFITAAHLVFNGWRKYQPSLSISGLRLARASENP
ncbi:Uncharacterised protein [Mycobacterium tuberculosis]|nr:Uncharacterised protein [Mycobacterium tuberculosis]